MEILLDSYIITDFEKDSIITQSIEVKSKIVSELSKDSEIIQSFEIISEIDLEEI